MNREAKQINGVSEPASVPIGWAQRMKMHSFPCQVVVIFQRERGILRHRFRFVRVKVLYDHEHNINLLKGLPNVQLSILKGPLERSRTGDAR